MQENEKKKERKKSLKMEAKPALTHSFNHPVILFTYRKKKLSHTGAHHVTLRHQSGNEAGFLKMLHATTKTVFL